MPTPDLNPATILRPARWAQVVLLFEVGEDARSDVDLAFDVRRAITVSLSARAALRCDAVGFLDDMGGRATLAAMQGLGAVTNG